jgi:hypothetical protein
MPNRLDEISRVIGNIEGEVRNLFVSVAEVRRSSAEQHKENREKLESIGGRVEKIEADIKPLAKTVATMEPIVAGYAVKRWKIAGAFAPGMSIITALGWVVSLFAGEINVDRLNVPVSESSPLTRLPIANPSLRADPALSFGCNDDVPPTFSP